MREKEAARTQLLADLRQALAADQFLLHFQPQVDQQGRWTGAEALLRWQHPRLGLLMPEAILPLAEQDGMMDALGQWVIETSCATLKRWSTTTSLARLTLAMNVSALQFRHPQFTARLEAALDRAWIDPRRLMLEFTEGLAFGPQEETCVKMQGLRARGVRFALDDFGCGYSSLSYLQGLPLDQLKIDQSFVRNILTSPKDAVIVRSVLALGHNLGLEVVAEGVETKEQFALLASYGCTGYRAFSSAGLSRRAICWSRRQQSRTSPWQSSIGKVTTRDFLMRPHLRLPGSVSNREGIDGTTCIASQLPGAFPVS